MNSLETFLSIASPEKLVLMPSSNGINEQKGSKYYLKLIFFKELQLIPPQWEVHNLTLFKNKSAYS